MDGFSAQTVIDLINGINSAVADDTPRWVIPMRPEVYEMLVELRRQSAWFRGCQRRRRAFGVGR